MNSELDFPAVFDTEIIEGPKQVLREGEMYAFRISQFADLRDPFDVKCLVTGRSRMFDVDGENPWTGWAMLGGIKYYFRLWHHDPRTGIGQIHFWGHWVI